MSRRAALVKMEGWGAAQFAEEGLVVAVGRGLPTGSTLTRPAGFDGLCGFRFTLRYLEFFRFLTAKRALLEAPAFPK